MWLSHLVQLKKSEIKRPEINRTKEGLSDTDFVLTTRELAMFLKEENVDFVNLEETNFDSPLGKGSSAGLIFGNSGGGQPKITLLNMNKTKISRLDAIYKEDEDSSYCHNNIITSHYILCSFYIHRFLLDKVS